MRPRQFVPSTLTCAIVLWLAPGSIASRLQSPARIPLDLSGLREGPISVVGDRDSVTVQWQDELSRSWTALFSLAPDRPLITAIGVEGKSVVEGARPLYWCETGKRRGGWDQFFDFPPSHPEGTRRFLGELKPRSAKARTTGDRVEILFDGLRIGIFEGAVAYTFFPGSRLVLQEAVVKTEEPDTAYFYDTGLRMSVPTDARPGGNMDMNNWGLPKRLLGEVDVFQIDSTHELYAHMNVNYVRMKELPGFDRYGLVLDALSRGDYFISTGEVLLPEVSISTGSSGAIKTRVKVLWTFPLSFAEIVWSDGGSTQRRIIPLDKTRGFSSDSFEWEAGAPNWKWARVAVWDVAGNGAFVNPVWRERQPSQ